MKKNYDILIIGGGLVGHSLAYALRDLPLSIALVEANTAPPSLNNEFDTRAISLSLGSANVFESLGLWQSMLNHAEPIHTVHVSEQGQFGFTRLKREEFNVPAFGYIAEISHLHQILLNATQQCANINFLCPTTLIKLDQDSAKVTATLRHTDTQIEEVITANLLIAADGANSIVRQLQKIPAAKHNYHQVAIATTLGLARDHQNIAYERFTSNGPLALLPLQNRRYAVVWTLPKNEAEKILALSDAEFTAELKKWIGYRLGRIVKVGHRAAYPLQQVQACQPRVPNTLLVGNAAHTLHPVVGQGFNLGLGDVATLVKIIHAELSKHSEKNENKIDLSAITHAYQQQRKWRQNSMAWFTHSLVECFAYEFAPIKWARNLGMIAVDRCRPLKSGLTHFLMDA